MRKIRGGWEMVALARGVGSRVCLKEVGSLRFWLHIVLTKVRKSFEKNLYFPLGAQNWKKTKQCQANESWGE